MADTKREQEEIARLAEAVIAGIDTIEVPTELTEEQPDAEKRAVELSLWAQIQEMSVSQKVKLALKGNKEARMILLRGANRLVQRMVLQNPRITEEEIMAIAKNRSADEELLRIIADNREWTGSYPLRCALVENAKTPIAKALRFLPSLGPKEIRVLAKSKNVPSVISNQARKILFQRESLR